VSVVIPHYNRSDLLEASVASVLASTDQSFEVIIIDDGSAPDDLQRARNLASDKVRVLERDREPKGPSRCRNLGVEASRGEFIVFLDSDDLMAPWCIEQRLRRADEEPARDLWVFPVMLFEKVPGDRAELWNRMENGVAPELRFMQSDPPWHTSSPLWRRDAFVRVGGFNERVFYGDDSDLHMRALIEGASVSVNSDELPDVFIRRSSAERITNSASLATSTRLARLSEGTRYLRSGSRPATYLSAWQGQYFAEAEYYLFNVWDPIQLVRQTLQQWDEDFLPLRAPLAAREYFRVALAFRNRAYLLLRLARRAAMLLLPPEFFSVAPDFQTLQASAESRGEVARRLGNSLFATRGLRQSMHREPEIAPGRAPVAVIAFRRLDHIQQTLGSLEKCDTFSGSEVIVHSDAPRAGRPEEAAAVERVRAWLRDWCRTRGALLIEASENLGLRTSVVSAVTRLVEKYGRVIVVEDDLFFSRHFLTFMNECLEKFSDREDIVQVSGYSFPHDGRLPDVGLLRTPGSWGWGTWDRAWRYYRDDAAALAHEVRNADVARFNFDDTYAHLDALDRNASGRLDTWLVRWYASVFLRGGLTLHPGESMVRNFGFGEDAENCKPGPTARRYSRQRVADRPMVVDPRATGSTETPSFVEATKAFLGWQQYQWGKPSISDRVRGKLQHWSGRA
jgi:glycosyltransferase involved in cell wall biosynthesis